MNQSLVGAGLYAGLAIGFAAGIAFQVARRAWKDFRTVKASVPGLRTTAWGFTRPAAGWAVIIVALVVGIAVVIAETA